jgi:hypothetical protein
MDRATPVATKAVDVALPVMQNLADQITTVGKELAYRAGEKAQQTRCRGHPDREQHRKFLFRQTCLAHYWRPAGNT